MRRTFTLALLAALCLGGLAACGDDSKTEAGSGDTTATTTAKSGGDGAAFNFDCITVTPGTGTPSASMAKVEGIPDALKVEPDVKVTGCATPTKLATKDVIEGTGDPTAAGAKVKVNYIGKTLADGKTFDSSWQRGQPASFGLDQVIKGWSDGLVGMKAGGRRILVIPADQAYGAKGSPPDIGPNAALVFVVDMLPSAKLPDALKTKPAVEIPPGPAPTTVTTKDLVVGTGPEASATSTVTVNYVGALFDGGKEFDASWTRGEPATFSLAGGVIPGFSQGIAGMKVGGRRLIVIPPDAGYGAQGRPPVIPANATLVFVVDLLEVS